MVRRKKTNTLTRAVIHVSTVKGVKRDPNDPTKWNYMMDPETKIGYIRITGFQDETPKELADAVEDLKSHGVRGIVLDGVQRGHDSAGTFPALPDHHGHEIFRDRDLALDRDDAATIRQRH